MAIAIKCPGCQAAFEVPESIAGKTIRCTSCKTQLTVPSPAAAGAEKKPFGSGAPAAKAAPAPAPAKAASVGSALSLDDDDDRPKSRPTPARPAARKDADDDDDEPKSRSTKPAKSAADMLPSRSKSSKPARRRDDDDDDEDEDDEPRRKPRRKQGSGAGPMLLLIGGGLLGLCAIVGVGVWFAMKSGNDDTAKSDGGNSPAETTPASDGGGGGGGGDPQINPREPGAGAGPLFTAPDGAFRVRFPGEPTTTPLPSGHGAIYSYSSDSPKELFIAMVAGDRAKTGQEDRRTLIRVIADVYGVDGYSDIVVDAKKKSEKKITVNGHSGSEGVSTTTDGKVSVGRSFTIGDREFVAMAISADQSAEARLTSFVQSFEPMVSGPADALTAKMQADGFIAKFPERPRTSPALGGGTVYRHTVGPLANPKEHYEIQFSSLPRNANPQQVLEGGLGGLRKMLNGRSGLQDQGTSDITQDGFPAKEARYSDQSGAGMLVRIVAAPGRLFILVVGGNDIPLDSAKMQGFVSSFKITYKPPTSPEPPGGIAMAPPGSTGMETPGFPEMPPGMPPEFPMPGMPPGIPPEFPMPPGGDGFPPGGDQGIPGNLGPPPGALTSPPLASKLTPFFAIAFDVENKEVYVVTHRWTGKKTEGLLYRYTYPDFRAKGSYNLPNLATKAVIDSKKGLLYLAAADLKSPVSSRNIALMHYDRAYATGDIHIIDLAPIRSGKVEDRSDIKPVGSVQVDASIRGLELAPDGKSLFVAVNRSSGRVTKGFLRQIDTTTRKQIREKMIPEQIVAMTLSPDGKDILALEFPVPVTKPVISLFVYDAESWTLRAVQLPAASTDVAATRDGKYLAAVIGTGAPSAAKLQLLATDGALPGDVPTIGWKASNNSYVAFSPDAKRLYVSSLGGPITPNGPTNAGLDVYDVENVADVKTYKKVSSIRESGGTSVGGYFHLSPDGEYIVFRTGAVLATAKLKENAGGLPGNLGNPGVVPPMPGVTPPGPGIPGTPTGPGPVPGGVPMEQGSPPAAGMPAVPIQP
jgi:predicted Zn finger-like uncharacterized protein